MYIIHELTYTISERCIPKCKIAACSTRSKAFESLQTIVKKELDIELTQDSDWDIFDNISVSIDHGEFTVVEWEYKWYEVSYRIEHVTDWVIDWEPNTLDVEIS